MSSTQALQTLKKIVKHLPSIVIGGGQAGLSVSYCLKQAGIEHLVFEKNSTAHAWRDKRWDTFCLVTPNWQCSLPGYDYANAHGGKDLYGFMKKDEIVRYVQSYAASFDPPLREGVEVTRLGKNEYGVFEIETGIGSFTADQVVVAIGGYHIPIVPRYAERLPDNILQLQANEYRNAESLPAGEVLVVGTGQSGCQIAEDLHLAGRKVHLCVGGAPRTARFYRGKDVVEWLHGMGHYDLPVDEHPLKERVRKKANHYVTGRDGGRDIDLRKFALEGMQLYGRLVDLKDGLFKFGSDLKRNLDQSDVSCDNIKNSIDQYIEKNAIDAPVESRQPPLWEPSEPVLALDYVQTDIAAVIWCIGYKADFRWIQVPVFDGEGYPGHRRGVTPVDGLYFIGLPWLYTWGSGRFSGIARDAAYIVEHLNKTQSISQDAAQAVSVRKSA